MSTSPKPVRLAIFASGRGSNAHKLLSVYAQDPTRKIGLILTENPDSGVFSFSKDFQVPVLLLTPHQRSSGDYLVDVMDSYQIDLIVLAGYLKKIPDGLIAQYPKEIVNIHPSLLPRYGGKGMYGDRVHRAVLAAGEKESGITIHFVNSIYDDGEIIFQQAVEISPEWTENELKEAIHRLEYTYYPKVIEKLCKKIYSQKNFS